MKAEGKILKKDLTEDQSSRRASEKNTDVIRFEKEPLFCSRCVVAVVIFVVIVVFYAPTTTTTTMMTTMTRRFDHEDDDDDDDGVDAEECDVSAAASAAVDAVTSLPKSEFFSLFRLSAPVSPFSCLYVWWPVCLSGFKTMSSG